MPGSRKALDLEVVVPVEDMARLGEILPPEEQPGGPVAFGDLRTSIWPAIHPKLLELIRAHRSTIVFTNSRRLAERLAQRLNELAGEELVRAHHGSIAREQRLQIEEDLKAGRVPAIVATSSLELGIDMGAVDLVVLVESPTSVASGCSGSGGPGHQVGEPSKGVLFPKFRGDLLEAAVVVQRMHDGRDRDHGDAPQPARRARPAARRDGRDGPLDRRRAARDRDARPRRSRRCRGRRSRRCWACSPAPIPRTSSPS